jgi:hypothetical protein
LPEKLGGKVGGWNWFGYIWDGGCVCCCIDCGGGPALNDGGGPASIFF